MTCHLDLLYIAIEVNYQMWMMMMIFITSDIECVIKFSFDL